MNAVRCDVLEAGMEIPMTRLCRILGVPRSTAYHLPKVERLHRPVDEALAQTIHGIIQAHPTYGIRRVWAWLKHRLDQPTNRKKIHRLMRIKGWTVRQRAMGKRPRVPGSRSIAPHPINAGAPISPSSSAARTGGARSFPSSTAAPERCWAGVSTAPPAPRPPSALWRRP